MTLFGGSFHLFESKDFVAIDRAERSILLIRAAQDSYILNKLSRNSQEHKCQS